MATEANPTASIPKNQATFHHPTIHGPKDAQSASDTGRRHSLPLHFLPPGLWSANTSTASLVESEEVVRGEHTLDEATVANRISALRQLNGATRSRHRYAKSTGARQSTFNQPVIVRTYSGAARPRSQQRDLVTVKKENGHSTMKASQVELKLPPVEAFSFKGIMDEIRHGVTEDLERIAEICARSKYSLSNQYEVHMPPHGRGEAILVGSVTNGGGPTLQAIGSDDEHSRHIRRGAARRTKSAAYGTLETIMSSSRSSEEDKSKKKPAAVLAEEVRGRAAKKELDMKKARTENAIEAGPSDERPTKHTRSKSATFASMIIDNAQCFKNDISSILVSPTSLISEPARPQTSNAELDNIATFGEPYQHSSAMESSIPPKPLLARNESRSSTLRPEIEVKPSILESLSSWLPWSRSSATNSPAEITRGSHAEGSLRDLLRSTDSDRKGKGVDRNA